jgi:hypothetical protein
LGGKPGCEQILATRLEDVLIDAEDLVFAELDDLALPFIGVGGVW